MKHAPLVYDRQQRPTTMTNWRLRFQDLIGEIEKHPMLNVLEAKLSDPTSPADIERAAKLAGGALPEGMADLYREMNGFQLEWEVEDYAALGATQPILGSIKLLPLIKDRGESVFGSWKNVVWFDGLETFRNVVPFDFFQPEACAAFYPVPGHMTVHYHYLGEEVHATGLTYSEYLELLFQSRGFLYWISALCADEQAQGQVEDFRAYFPKLFDSDTLPTFAPR
jgi:hypothetical protein